MRRANLEKSGTQLDLGQPRRLMPQIESRPACQARRSTFGKLESCSESRSFDRLAMTAHFSNLGAFSTPSFGTEGRLLRSFRARSKAISTLLSQVRSPSTC